MTAGVWERRVGAASLREGFARQSAVPRELWERRPRREFARAWLLAIAFMLAPAPAAAGVSATGADGATVTLEHPAKRIVALSPALVETAYAAGAGDRLVGVVAYSDYPPPAAGLPRVGDAFRLDLERLLSLKPDLVLAWQSGNPRAAVQRLRELDVPVLVTEVHALDDVARQIETLGRLAGTPGAARAAAKRYRSRLDALRVRYGGRDPVSVFYQVDDQPLYTVGGTHIVSRAIELCGGRNVFAGLDTLAPSVSEEAVISADPEAIVAPIYEGGSNDLERWRKWPGMKAVERGNLFTVEADDLSRATPRLADGVEALCRALDTAREHRP